MLAAFYFGAMRWIAFLLLVLFGLRPYAQEAAISAVKQNILYAGIDNPIEFAARDYACRSVFIASDNGSVARAANPCLYDVRPVRLGTATLTLCTMKGRDTVRLREMIFRVKRVPDGQARISGRDYFSGMANLSGIKAVLAEFDFEVRIKVKEFQLAILHRDGSKKEFGTKSGGAFTEEMRAELGRTSAGDSVIVSGIVARYSDSTTRPMNDIRIKIQD